MEHRRVIDDTHEDTEMKTPTADTEASRGTEMETHLTERMFQAELNVEDCEKGNLGFHRAVTDSAHYDEDTWEEPDPAGSANWMSVRTSAVTLPRTTPRQVHRGQVGSNLDRQKPQCRRRT